MKDEFLDYIEDIIDAMDKAEILLTDVDYEQFAADFKINFAAVRALEIVGEATKQLPSSLRDRYPHIPWREMAGMRDKMIHGYRNVNLKTVWDTVKNRIPIVKPMVQQILDDYS